MFLVFFISDLVKNLEIGLFHWKAGIQYEYKDYMGEIKSQWENLTVQSHEEKMNQNIFSPTMEKSSINLSKWSFPVLQFCASVELYLATPRSKSSPMFIR